MADELRIGLSELLRKAMIEQDASFLKEGVRLLSQALMEMEVEEHVGAGRHERSPARTGQRNGYRQRDWDTRVGTVELRVPRVRDSSYFPSLLEPRRRAERALSAVVQEAYVRGISTRKVDDLVRALGMEGISKSQVSRLCEELDEEVERFRGRPLEGPYPYVWLDATYVKARQDGRVASVAVVIAVGVNEKTGEREILGLDVGPKTAERGRCVGLGRRPERGRGVLDLFPALLGRPRSSRGKARDERRSSRTEGCHRSCPCGRLLAEVPGALHEKRPLFGS
jgi:transposase-like protein